MYKRQKCRALLLVLWTSPSPMSFLLLRVSGLLVLHLAACKLVRIHAHALTFSTILAHDTCLHEHEHHNHTFGHT